MADALDIRLAGMTIDRDGLANIRQLCVQVLEQARMQQAQFDYDECMRQGAWATATEAKCSLKNTQGMLDEIIGFIDNLSPETTAAAYAYISRDGDPIHRIREKARADVERSRKSFATIYFGLGHKSIAEHVQFNFDIMGISRRAVEAIEEKRLQGYTEKSQRYITLDGDFVLPKEIEGTPFEERFINLVLRQSAFYKDHLAPLVAWHSQQEYSAHFEALGIADNPKRQQGTLEGFGKEDARYALPMATQAQLGMTTSARSLEVLITKLRSSGVDEWVRIGDALFTETQGIAPSVVKYTDPTDYFTKTRPQLRSAVGELICIHGSALSSAKLPSGRLITADSVELYTRLARDDAIIAGLVFSSSDLSFGDALRLTEMMSNAQKNSVLDAADRYQEKHDPKLREFELGDRVAQIEMSSSAYAQMKRHRMNTLIPQEYIPALGITTPLSIIGAGLQDELTRLAAESERLYTDMMRAGVPRPVAETILTNAHTRRVLFDANNRQVYAFGAERLNLPAQWDIRKKAEEYKAAIMQDSPLTLRGVGGKHEFYTIKESFGLPGSE